jgi:fumarate reductase iron-sulfur subunit
VTVDAVDTGGMLNVEVWRGAETGAFQTFTLPRRLNQTILDVVTEIQREQDPTLSYRFACRVGMCGSCAMVVNGRPRWTCRTRVSEVASLDGALRLEPLRNFTIVKDLAVEMTTFFDKWRDAHGAFEPGPTPAADFAVVPPATPARHAADEAIECIGCGICYSACDVVAWDRDYLGPAALNRAFTLVHDSRDGAREARLQIVDGEHGCWRCHTQLACMEVCPKTIDTTGAIGDLKRQLIRRRVGRVFRPK